MKPYNLGVTPCTFDATSDPRWAGDGYCLVEPAGIVELEGEPEGIPEFEVIDDAVFGKLVKKLKMRAAEHGRSAEAEHREILRQALLPRRAQRSLKEILSSMPAVGRDEDFERSEDLGRPIWRDE